MSFSFSKEYSQNAYTDVENVFISEYLPISSGNAVKVYLYGLFLCKNEKDVKTLSDFAEAVYLTETEVKDCFKYWEEFGLLTVLSEEPFSVNYLPVKSVYSGKPRKFKAEKYTDFTKGLQAIISARMIPTNEFTEYFSIMETYSIKPEAMLMIVKYCVDLKGNNIGYHYVSTVAKDFGVRQINTVEKVERELSTYVLHTGEISKILKALSSKRQPDIEDLKYLNKWQNELNFETESIVFAASKIKKGSFEKLDEFLMELYSMKSFSKEEIADYMNKKQRVYELAIRINRALSLYVDVIDTVVDTYTKKWLSYGFSEDALIYIAGVCFKNGNNKLANMDELVESLYQKGCVDLTSVSDYFDGIQKTDEFIKKVLITAGITRRPNEWDRNNLATWKNWNFSDEMILQAAGLASGKSSPIPYMNGILSNWKHNNVFTTSDIPENSTNATTNTQEAYNLEYEKRRNLAVGRAQKNMEKAMEIEGFASIYGRLNSIERDLAFAEMEDNLELLNKLESEKENLNNEAESLLNGISLTLSDLSPKYKCDKCKDTGYVGTHRCDCLGK